MLGWYWVIFWGEQTDFKFIYFYSKKGNVVIGGLINRIIANDFPSIQLIVDMNAPYRQPYHIMLRRAEGILLFIFSYQNFLWHEIWESESKYVQLLISIIFNKFLGELRI